MKEEILKRPMFSEPMSKKTMNVGIMQGFEDEMDDEMEDEMEESSPMSRTPQNPEILMNNLRGDIRSIDARYLELAQMVGEDAAMETPPEVLAMLQGQLGAQAQMPPVPAGGIGALPQAAQMAGSPMMPPGMEGAPPFPPGGAEQAPPTPDGMPPLRAADGVFVTQGARLSQPFMPDMSRAMALVGGEIPPDQMSAEEANWLQSYRLGTGFGGSIRDIASQGASRLSGALAPYMARGRDTINRIVEKADEYLPSFQGLRVGPLRGADQGRVVLQGRENIVAGPGGMPQMGTGTKFQPGGTIEAGRIPFSQAVRESFRVNPKSTALATGVGAGTAASMLSSMFGGGGGDMARRSPEELARVVEQINQIPTDQGPRAFSDVSPATATINVANAEQLDLSTPFDTIPKPGTKPPPLAAKGEAGGPTQPPVEGTVAKDAETFIKDKLKEEAPLKTRAERIKEEYKGLEPTFRELLGDTQSDMRTNALLLLADAGFKFASTYKPTMAMAFAESFAGVPKGFAALVAQAKDRDIKVKTAVLQQAVDNVNLQDKYARDFQIEGLKIQGKTIQELLKAKNAKELEAIKARNAKELEVYKGDIQVLIKQIETGGVIEEPLGMGYIGQKTKGGSFIGAYIKPDKDGNLPPVVRSAIDSRWTLRQTDNPYVENRGPAPTTVVDPTDKKSLEQLGATLRGLDDSLRTLDDLRGQYSQLYSPGTWFNDKINNIIVPISGGMIRPDVNQVAAATSLKSGLNTVMKRIAAANDQGRVAVREQEWAREMLDGLTDPTAFFSNKEIAAKQFATMETTLRNARQQVLTQLGFVSDDMSMRVPSVGTQNDPFVVPTDPQEQQNMFRYLASTIGAVQDPRASVYIRMPNGRVDQFNPVQLRGLVQK